MISQDSPISRVGFKSSAEKQMHRGQIKKQEEQVNQAAAVRLRSAPLAVILACAFCQGTEES